MGDPTGDVALLPVEEVVPPRSVLTELARGFLLTRDHDGSRARRFASTFLRERASSSRRTELPSPPEPGVAVTQARRLLGRLPHGAVERPSPFSVP